MIGFPFTSRAKVVMDLARVEAEKLHAEYVGTEYLLLAIMTEGKGFAAEALRHAGVDFDTLRQDIINYLQGRKWWSG